MWNCSCCKLGLFGIKGSLLHGGKLKDPGWLTKHAAEYLEEFKQAQEHLSVPPWQSNGNVWRPPPQSLFKLNFDATIFKESNSSGFSAVIQNEQGEVMAALSTIGPTVTCSEEAETMACRKTLEFAVDAGFSKLVVEGDNANVMRAVSSSTPNMSMLGNVIDDIQFLLCGLRRASTSRIKRGGNRVAYVLARHANEL
ncbi:uncharacterized protein LOC126691287 [Quercus robur]|uniref:uncharacterized protein LOC126691287 n=1 Tax=Quercus robur TaxID=38942 RepID=UPI002163CDEF|nr:uncharacterized protein LOC126691287 [Quercus robur]